MITITYTQEELNALAALLDAAVKATGLSGARAAVPLMAKLEQAVSEANAKAAAANDATAEAA